MRQDGFSRDMIAHVCEYRRPIKRRLITGVGSAITLSVDGDHYKLVVDDGSVHAAIEFVVCRGCG